MWGRLGAKVGEHGEEDLVTDSVECRREFKEYQSGRQVY